MSPEDTLDIGGTIDQKLASWPAPTRDDAAWGARAEAILGAAQSAPRASDATLSSLLEPPRLDPEPGEPGATVSGSGPVRAAGEKLMSQESNPGGAPPKSEVMPTSAATPSKRPSLKELAARASQTGAARSSIPGASTPPPAASKPVSDAPPAAKPSIRPPAPSSPPRISDPDHDSGIIDLNKVNAAATPQQIAAAEKAKPAAHDLVGDDDKSEAAPAKEAAKVASLADAREKKAEKKGGSGGAIAGLAIALIGMAAGVAIWVNGRQKPADTTAQSGKENPPAAVQAAPPSEPQKVAEAPKAEPQGLSIDSLPPAEAEAQKRATPQPAGGGTPADSQKLAAQQQPATTDKAAPAPAGTAPPIGDKPGDLSSAMAKAVGDSGEKSVNTDGATPANGGKAGNQSVPEKPSQGSVNSAVGSVMGGAKACVAGADDVSRAQITFGSNGSVQNVSVTGWAANNGQSGCVKSALKGASVGPFSQPTFTVGVTIRP
jgi:hypothetical protein